MRLRFTGEDNERDLKFQNLTGNRAGSPSGSTSQAHSERCQPGTGVATSASTNLWSNWNATRRDALSIEAKQQVDHESCVYWRFGWVFDARRI